MFNPACTCFGANRREHAEEPLKLPGISNVMEKFYSIFNARFRYHYDAVV